MDRRGLLEELAHLRSPPNLLLQIGNHSCNSVQVWKPENQQSWQYNSRYTAKGLRNRSSRREREQEFTLPYLFCSTQVLSGSDEAHPHWGGKISFTQFTDSNSKLLPEMLSETHPEMFYQLSRHPLTQPSWYVKYIITGLHLAVTYEFEDQHFHFCKKKGY